MLEGSVFNKRLTSVFDKRTATALASLKLETVADLLYHFPRKYHFLGELTDLSRADEGHHVTVVARIQKMEVARARDRNLWLCKLVVATKGGRSLDATLFGRGPKMAHVWQKDLQVGSVAMFEGKLATWRGQIQLRNATFHLLDPGGQNLRDREGMIKPIYPASAKAATWFVERCMLTVLPMLSESDLPDVLPDLLLAEKGWPGALEALRFKHNPRDKNDVVRADERLRFEEAYVLQTALARRRAQASALPSTPRPASEGGLLAAFDATLPFELTAGQREVGAQIAADLASEHPMHRLLQGEVGSGKTIVALRAMLAVVDAGGQAALLAPTEVLAQQHHRSITAMLGDLASAGMLPLAGPVDDDGVVGTRVALLTGSQGAKARREALGLAADGQAGIVIGTHALIQDSVEFADLGLVVVDEQHRFGVEQRDALRAKSLRTPHLLVMTATPIPRTVAMTVFGDLETSTLREVPAGRQPITTHVVPIDKPAWVARTWQVVREQVAQGRQVFIVCPAIEPRDDADRGADHTAGPAGAAADDGVEPVLLDLDGEERRPLTTVAETFDDLVAGELAGLSLAMLHGKMTPDAKDEVMQRFAAGELDAVVATTVIEVGVDVPNASVMVVMDANRFGISQLHQLRGRVGRGGHNGFCFLVATSSGPATEMLEQVAATTDGFALARLDLAHRREGDVLGAAQSGGLSSLRVLRVTDDEEVIVEARALASELIADDPDLARHPCLKAAIDRLLNPEREVFLERG